VVVNRQKNDEFNLEGSYPWERNLGKLHLKEIKMLVGVNVNETAVIIGTILILLGIAGCLMFALHK